MRLIFSFVLILCTVTILNASEQRQKVKVCISPNAMPIEMNENNRHIGMAADFLEMLGR
jgi:hypothetical protein